MYMCTTFSYLPLERVFKNNFELMVAVQVWRNQNISIYVFILNQIIRYLTGLVKKILVVIDIKYVMIFEHIVL